MPDCTSIVACSVSPATWCVHVLPSGDVTEIVASPVDTLGNATNPPPANQPAQQPSQQQGAEAQEQWSPEEWAAYEWAGWDDG